MRHERAEKERDASRGKRWRKRAREPEGLEWFFCGCGTSEHQDESKEVDLH